jgi:hypothetical protein
MWIITWDESVPCLIPPNSNLRQKCLPAMGESVHPDYDERPDSLCYSVETTIATRNNLLPVHGELIFGGKILELQHEGICSILENPDENSSPF